LNDEGKTISIAGILKHTEGYKNVNTKKLGSG